MDGLVTITNYRTFVAMNLHEVVYDPTPTDVERILNWHPEIIESGPTTTYVWNSQLGTWNKLPTAADLDAIEEEKRIAELTK